MRLRLEAVLSPAGLALAAACTASPGLTAPPSPTVAAVTVVATSPLPGTGIDVAKAPYAVQTLTAADLQRGGLLTAPQALVARAGEVSLNENLGDPFQPDILYRGFEASPVLGTPQGLAVYQNGVRVNEAFGDAVNWDLIPDFAIARLDLVGSNPVYGLNALGGAVVVTTKTGFDSPGGQAEVSGGSFGRRVAQATYGASRGPLAAFVGARWLDEDGWRRFSSDHVRQAYGDVAAQGERLSLDLSLTAADNRLHGQSPAPVQELAVDRRLVFTSPQANLDRLAFATLRGSYRIADAFSLQGVAYWRGFGQRVENGDASDYGPCAPAALAGRLCQPDALTPVTGPSGAPLPDLSQGGALPIGQNDRERLSAQSYGGALQASSSARLFGRPNQALAGLALDVGQVSFRSSAEIGLISPDLVVQPSGLFVVTSEGSAFTATPVSLGASSVAIGLYLTDTLDLTDRLSVTASGRWNHVRIALHDRLGSALSGTSRYQRFNPAIGLAFRAARALSLYAGYAEGSRAPTPSEIDCSDPARPCLLPSSLSADPPRLRQVVSQTLEAGLRGDVAVGAGRLSYHLGLYRTGVRDDIYAVATSLSAGFFRNIPGTLRQGGEAALAYRGRRATLWASYAFVDATFRSALTLPSPSHPFADAGGAIQVRPGDRLPGIPRQRFKLGAEYELGRGLRLGGDLQIASGQFYRGDESNQLKLLAGYAVAGLHAAYEITRHAGVYVRIENLFDARYATFGLLGDATGVGAPGVPETGANPRFQTPASPRAVYAGLQVSF